MMKKDATIWLIIGGSLLAGTILGTFAFKAWQKKSCQHPKVVKIRQLISEADSLLHQLESKQSKKV